MLAWRFRASPTPQNPLAPLFAALLALAGLSALPALADDSAEIHGLKGEYRTHSAPGAFDVHTLKATTCDRAVLKPDTARLRTAHEAPIRDASRVTPTRCPAARPVLD
jgi:hypothetical protein